MWQSITFQYKVITSTLLWYQASVCEGILTLMADEIKGSKEGMETRKRIISRFRDLDEEAANLQTHGRLRLKLRKNRMKVLEKKLTSKFLTANKSN